MGEIAYEKDPDDDKILWITFKGAPWRAVDARLFRGRPALPLLEGGLESAFEELEYRIACRFALKRLSGRACFKKELEQELKRRLVSKKGTERALAECERLGYLDDEAHLKAFLEREARSGSGPAWILQKLVAKGFSKGEAEALLSGVLSEEELIRQMQLLVEKKRRGRGSLDAAKLRALLVRKGYPYALIREFLAHLSSTS